LAASSPSPVAGEGGADVVGVGRVDDDRLDPDDGGRSWTRLQNVWPAAARTAAAWACARLTWATLTSWAELSLRSRYSSGASGGCVSPSSAGGRADGAA
jgi:hypothetical protein